MPTCLVFAGPVKNNKYFVGNITNSIFFADLQTIPINYVLDYIIIVEV